MHKRIERGPHRVDDASAGRLVRLVQDQPEGTEPRQVADELLLGNDGVAVTTVSPPVLVNRSLYINPHRHAYATRERDKFPALV